MGDRVLAPGFMNPVGDAAEIEITGRDQGRFAVVDGYSSYVCCQPYCLKKLVKWAMTFSGTSSWM
jgi:hypothetical protein